MPTFNSLNFIFFCFAHLKILLLWQQAEENVLFWQHDRFFIRIGFGVACDLCVFRCGPQPQAGFYRLN
jgi:hypothetical protein